MPPGRRLRRGRRGLPASTEADERPAGMDLFPLSRAAPAGPAAAHTAPPASSSPPLEQDRDMAPFKADDEPFPPLPVHDPAPGRKRLRTVTDLGRQTSLACVAEPTGRLGLFAEVGEQVAATAVLCFRVPAHDLEAHPLVPAPPLLQAGGALRGLPKLEGHHAGVRLTGRLDRDGAHRFQAAEGARQFRL
jgi:hypothetical protein